MIEQMVERLKSPSSEVQSAARDELMQMARSGTATIADAAALIKAATGEFPAFEHSWEDRSATCLWAARDIARDKDPGQLLAIIERAFPRLSPSSRIGALQIVVLAGTPEAARMYIRLLEASGDQIKDGPIPEFDAAAGSEVAAELFPGVLGLARSPHLAFPIFSMLLGFRNEDVVPADVAKEYHGSLARVLQAEIDAARRLQKPSGVGWRDEAPYSEHRDMIGLMFDVAGKISSTSLKRVMVNAGDLLDPRLRRFRACSLLQLGSAVPQSELDWIARSPRDRFWLFEQLHRLGLADRLPAECRDQARLAEGNMVDWLCFGTELGREPDEIELIHTETRNRSDAKLLVRWLAKRNPVDYYFFRFRVTEEHWSKEHGWTVGMAGGYPREEQATTHHDGGTFSTFDSFESKSLKEHVAGYLE